MFSKTRFQQIDRNHDIIDQDCEILPGLKESIASSSALFSELFSYFHHICTYNSDSKEKKMFNHTQTSRRGDSGYADNLLTHARSLFDFADQHR